MTGQTPSAALTRGELTGILIGAVAAVAILAAILLATTTVSAGATSCGSALSPTKMVPYAENLAGYYEAAGRQMDCDDAILTRQWLAGGVLLVGVFVGGGIWMHAKETARKAAREEQS